jgi:hypothetical protein
MATDRASLKMQQAGALGSFASGGTAVSDAVGTVGQAHSDIFVFDKAAADAMASTTTAETYTGINLPYAGKVKAITFVPTSGGLTADASNYATVTVSRRDSAAANKTTLGTITTTVASSGNLTQGVGEDAVLTSANVDFAADSTVTFEIAKTGTGVVVPAGRFTVLVEWT